MSTLLKSLLNKAKKTELGHDIHENCVITEATVVGKPGKDNQASKWNCVTKFVKKDNDGNVIGEKEISWYDLDHTSEWVKGKFTSQMVQLVNILECFYTPVEVDAIFNPIFADFEITKDEASLEDILKDKENSKNLMTDIAKAYVAAMVPHLNSFPVRLKLVFDSKGKYVGQPQYNEVVESMSVPKAESKLRFSKNEIENEVKSRNVITAAPASKQTLAAI
jgi:hypothetical protein